MLKSIVGEPDPINERIQGDYMRIGVQKLNQGFAPLLDKAFNLAFLSMDRVRDVNVVSPFDVMDVDDKIDTKKIIA